MFTLRNGPANIQTILKDSFVLYRQTLCSSLLYSIIIAGCISLPPLLILPFSSDSLHLSSFFIILAGQLLAFILSSALLFHLYCFCQHVKSNMTNSLKQVFLKLPALLLLMIIYTLIVLSGVMLLIIPGIILAFSLIFSFILVLTNNKAVLQNLITSHDLVWGHWRHTFFTISTPLLLDMMLSLIGFIIIAKIMIYFALPTVTTAFLLAAFNIVLQSFFIPFLISVSLLLFHDLIQRKALHSPPWN